MQVRKFEAKTMKEALNLVKTELGPEAIILSAKDNSQSFGLMGDSSVEITAAISEKTLHKRKLAEKKIKKSEIEQFRQSPANTQKKFINKVYNRAVETVAGQRKIEARPRYIDIGDQEDVPVQRTSEQIVIPEVSRTAQAAAQSRPTQAMPPQSIQVPQPVTQASPTIPASNEVAGLKREISRLKKVIADFQKMPQSFISVHPGAEKGIPFEFSAIYEKLDKVGIDDDILLRLIYQARKELIRPEQQKKHMIDAWMAQKILETTQVCANPYTGFVQVFAGGAGQGKTSSLVKMASRMVVEQGKRIALITADSFKVGAADQLKIFAQILNVPFATVRGQADWHQILKELGDYDHLLVDFPSLQLSKMHDVELLKRLMPPQGVDSRTHLVISATSKSGDAEELARRYRLLNFQDVIFTRLDESLNHGLIYNFQIKFDVPVNSFGIGTRIPEDFEIATRERVLDLLFRLTKTGLDRGDT